MKVLDKQVSVLGTEVLSIEPLGIGAMLRLEPGHRLVAVDGKAVNTPTQLETIVGSKKGAAISVDVIAGSPAVLKSYSVEPLDTAQEARIVLGRRTAVPVFSVYYDSTPSVAQELVIDASAMFVSQFRSGLFLGGVGALGLCAAGWSLYERRRRMLAANDEPERLP